MQQTLDKIRFSGDIDFYNKCLENENIKKIRDVRLNQRHDDSYRRRLLGSSLKINSRLSPKLFSMVSNAANIAGLGDKDIEVYIYNSPEQNATCYYNGKQQIILTFSSALLHTMNDNELKFVIGHELGHALFEHSNLPSTGIAEDDNCSAQEAMQLMSWSRRAEISADRMGLFVCKDEDAAISSFLKLSCGVSSPIINFDIKEYTKQIQDLKSLSTNLDDTSQCYSTHPFNPIRVAAVGLYAKSEHFTKDASSAMPFDKIDHKINELLDFMEPVDNAQKKQISDEFIMWAGVLVALADGEFTQDEHANLREQLGDQTYQAFVEELNQADDMESFARGKMNALLPTIKTLSAPDCCSIIQRLIVVARADQKLHHQERVVLEEIAEQLSVDKTFINQILLFL